MSPIDLTSARKIGSEDRPRSANAKPNLKLAEAKLSSVSTGDRKAETGFVASENLDSSALGTKLGYYSRRDISAPLRKFIPYDALALLMGFVAAWLLSSAVNSLVLGRELKDAFDNGGMLRLVEFLAISAGVMLWFENSGHYRSRMPFWSEAKRVVYVLGAATIVDGFIQFASKTDFSRLWLVTGWFFSAAGILLLRALLRAKMMKAGTWQISTLLVGCGITSREARDAIEAEPDLGYVIKSRICDIAKEFSAQGMSWESICADHGVDHVVIALDGHELADADGAMAQLMREEVPFSVSPPLCNLPVLGMERHYFFNRDVMLLTRSSNLEQPLPNAIKRSFDVVVSGVALLFLSPLFLVLAAIVKMDGGTAFFPNRRIGVDGKEFDCLKFRSMVPDSDKVLDKYLAEAGAEVRFEWQHFKKLRGEDPRVTRFGRFLRRTSLDELPQILNVFKGDMSLVGPRPILPR